jgi:hypothetical protein
MVGVVKQRRRETGLLLFLCVFHKLVFLISSIKKFNSHVSFIGSKTGEKGE